MKQRLLPIMMAAVAMLALGISACSSDSDEESKDPRLRILGNWKINYDSGRNTSSEDMYYIFTSDGKILFPLDITNQTVIEGTYQFVDGWTYNEEKDEGFVYYSFAVSFFRTWRFSHHFQWKVKYKK